MSWFKCPNNLIDEILPHVSGEELKIIIFLQRKTAGWQKTVDRISRSQIILGTGLSEATVKRKLKSLSDRGILCKVSEGTGRRSSEWMVTLPEPEDEPEEEEIQRIEGDILDPPYIIEGSHRPPRGVTENRLQPVEGSHRPPQKTNLKYTYSKERPPPGQAEPALVAATLSDREKRRIRASGISPPYLKAAISMAERKGIQSAAYIIATGKNMETENKLTNDSRQGMRHKTTDWQDYLNKMRTDLSTIQSTANQAAHETWQWLCEEYPQHAPPGAVMMRNQDFFKLVKAEKGVLYIHAINWNLGGTFKRAHLEGVKQLLRTKYPKGDIEVTWD